MILTRIIFFVNSFELIFLFYFCYTDRQRGGGMFLSEAIEKRISNLCIERNITLNKLSTICGITQSTLNNLVHRDNKSITVLTVLRICNGLQMNMKDFFDDPLFQNLDDD